MISELIASGVLVEMKRSKNAQKDLVIYETKEEDLFRLAKCSIRTGSTIDIKTRANQYRRIGYRGIMAAARTENMERAEEQMLFIQKPANNRHVKSNNTNMPGYIYAIFGEKVEPKVVPKPKVHLPAPKMEKRIERSSEIFHNEDLLVFIFYFQRCFSHHEKFIINLKLFLKKNIIFS